MFSFRPNVKAMRAYVPGEQPPAGAKIVKLNTNENPYPPSPHVREAIIAELADGGERLRKYSDPAALELRRAASDVLNFPVEQIMPGNGSDELLAILCRALVTDGDTIAYPYPTYVLYETLAHMQGANIQTVDFPADFSLPKELFGSSAKIVFLASPNSPSGTTYPIEQIKALAQSLYNGVLVIDEAYAEFADHNCLALAREMPNVVVLRTFSKSHGLAGMRLGLLFASADIINNLWKVKDSYNLDRLAIVAGAAALRDTAWTAEAVRKIKATRAALDAGLRELGLQVIPSHSNFIFTRFKNAEIASGAYKYLKDNGILTRYFSARLLDNGLRITVGTDEENAQVLSSLKSYLTAN